MAQEIPFLLEDKISSLGGQYEKATELWAVSLCKVDKRVASEYSPQPHVVVSGNLITGQNPASAKGIAEAIHKALSD